MPKLVLIDVICVNVKVPPRIPNAEADAVRRTLRGPRFMARLRRVVRAVFHGHPSLAKVRVSLTR